MIKNILNKDSFRSVKDLPTLSSNLTEFSSRLYIMLDQLIEEVGVLQTGGFVSSNSVRTIKSDVVIPPVNPWTHPADATHDGYLLASDWNIFNNKYNLPWVGGYPDMYLYTDGFTTYWKAVPISGFDHATLINLDYASSGHTGFQAELGYTPLNITHTDPLSGGYDHSVFLTTDHLTDFVHADIVHGNRAALDLVSGLNTGDQDIDSISPLSAKGDILTFTTVNARLPVGTNTYLLSANSATTTGLEWVAPGSMGLGTVTDVSVANSLDGIYLTIANGTTTPALSISLQAITPWSVNTDAAGYYMIDSVAAVVPRNTGWMLAGAGNITSSGLYNILLGSSSGVGLTSGYRNTLMGYNSSANLTSGYDNVSFGSDICTSATGHKNISIGVDIGVDLTSGAENISIGRELFNGGTSTGVTGTHNILLGQLMGYATTSGSWNIGIGYGSFMPLTTGSYNLALGTGLVSVSTGSYNIGIGVNSLHGINTGSNNIGIGYYAGYYATGSDGFYLNTRNRTNTAGDKSGSLLYGLFHDTVSSQLLYVNAGDIRLGDSSTNYTKFDSTGHQTMVGTAKPWDDLRIEPIARTTGTNAPTFEKWFDNVAGTSRGVYLYSFPDEAIAGNQKEIFFTMQMPHGWDGGNIDIHVHWVGASTVNTSDVLWGLEYTWKDIGEVFGDTTEVSSSLVLTPDDANITAGKHYISSFSVLTPGTTADGLSSILIGRLFRNSSDASDTYTDKVGLLYIDAHYQINSIGSTDEYSK